VNEAWVLNASPIILFGRIDRLDLIDRLAPRLMIPDAVIDEIRGGRSEDVSARIGLDFAEPYRAAHWDLGRGETQVITQALDAAAWAVLDDLAARRCAATYNIPVIGSIGILLRAKRKGILENVAPWMMKLKAAGMYVDEMLIQKVLADVGEQVR